MFLDQILLLILLLSSAAATTLEQEIQAYEEHKDEQFSYSYLLQRIWLEREYTTCLIYGDRRGIWEAHTLEKLLQLPVLIYDQRTVYENAFTFNKELLALVYLKDPNPVPTVRNLSKNVLNIYGVRIVFVCPGGLADVRKLSALFSACWQHRLLNVIAIFRDFADTRQFYSYTPFPALQLELRDLSVAKNISIYPNRMGNLYGHPLRTNYHPLSPRAALLLQLAGGQLVVSYTLQLLRLLAQKHNATLTYMRIGAKDPILFEDDLLPLTRNGSVDVASNPASPHKALNYNEFSYPFDTARRCVNNPVGGRLTYPDFFMGYLNWMRQAQTALCGILSASIFCIIRKVKNKMTGQRVPIRFVDFFLNQHVMGGVLGFAYVWKSEPTASQRVMLTMVFLWGLIFTTAVISRINSFLRTPPMEMKPFTLPMANWSSLKILVSRKEYEALVSDTMDEFYKYPCAFEVLHALEDFEFLQHSIDPRFLYPVTFSHRLTASDFHRLATVTTIRSTKICFKQLIHLSLPMAPNSIYRESLKLLIMRLQDMGLLDYWASQKFDDLTSSEWIKPVILEPLGIRRVLPFRYFHLIWKVLIGVYIISPIIFCCELLYFYKLKSLKFRSLLRRRYWRRKQTN